MARESFVAVSRRRLFGLTYIVVIIGLVLLSVAVYNKDFTKVVLVTLKTDHTGNELGADSDVKERGIIVGSVRKVRSDGDGAEVTLALEPGRVGIIPSNVSAQILPKTLFGEQYVSLNIPADPAAHIKAGDVIPQDRSQGALETEKVLGDTLPLLQALHPAELNATLTAVAQALQGRGTELGDTLVQLDNYLRQLNSTSPDGKTYTSELIDDLTQLGKVATLYNSSAPDIIATLNNLQTTTQTLVSRQAALTQLLDIGASASDTLSQFLSDNEQRLITVTGTTDQVYKLLAHYGPSFACTFGGFNKLQGEVDDTIKNNQIQLTITVDAQPSDLGAYTPADKPEFVSGYGPNCFDLPNGSSTKFEVPPSYQCLNDGAALTTAPCSQDAAAGYTQESVGSAAETALVNSIIAPEYGTTPEKVPAVATILAAPALRGSEVKLK